MMQNDSKKNYNVWGLTGGIASGKSTVAKILVQAGLTVIDADDVARKLRTPGGRAYGPILKLFGTVDAAELKQIVFSDPRARRELEAILHPLIREESERLIAQAATEGKPVIYEASLLVELWKDGRYRHFAGLILVTTHLGNQIQRLMNRDGCTPEIAGKILNAQISDDERRKFATFVLENNAGLNELRIQALSLIPRLKVAN